MNEIDVPQSDFDEPALSDDSPRPQSGAPVSEERYFSLFEHASEAMVFVSPARRRDPRRGIFRPKNYWDTSAPR